MVAWEALEMKQSSQPFKKAFTTESTENTEEIEPKVSSLVLML